MKNIKLLGIIAMIGIIGLSMTGCPMDADETNETGGVEEIDGLEGTWRRVVVVSPPIFDTLILSGNTFQLQGFQSGSGTFTIDGNQLNFMQGALSIEATFSRSGRTLNITEQVPPGTSNIFNFAGTWTRQ